MRLFVFSAAIIMATATGAMAGFVGALELDPVGCQSSGKCTLKVPFGYIDPSGLGWEARAGLITDGASIPDWAQSLVGAPFEEGFIKAAVIHDHYCDRRVRPWRQTHRVFYDALLDSGVTKSKAGMMYFAILVGGPKWVKLVDGKPCALGFPCVNDVKVSSEIPNLRLEAGEQSDTFLTRDERYGSPEFQAILAEKLPAMSAKGEDLTREDVELEAAKAMAGDVFFSNGDEIGGSADASRNSK